MKVLDKNMTNRVDPINFLRVVATMMVFGQHISQYGGKELARLAQTSAAGNLVFVFRFPAWAGVWIFFILSGYLAGKGFASGRYSADKRGVLGYYRNRITKTYVPALVFVLCELFFEHLTGTLNNPGLILRLVFCLFNGGSGFSGMGHTWYIFMLMWLYLVTPPVCALLDQIRDKSGKKRSGQAIFWGLLTLFALGGFIYRIAAHRAELDWYDHIYTPPYGNLDMYFCGVLLAYLKQSGEREYDRKRAVAQGVGLGLSAVGVVFVVLINSLVYFLSTDDQDMLNLYRYVFPTLYLIAVLLFIGFADVPRARKNNALSLRAVVRNPLRLIDSFASVSFYAYLFHISVKNALVNVWSVDGIWENLAFIAVTVFASCIFGWLYGKVFRNREAR